MKRPYYDRFGRQLIYSDTFVGATMRLRLEVLKIGREINKTLIPAIAPIIRAPGLNIKPKYQRYLS